MTATEGRTATYPREVTRRAALRVAETTAEGALRVDGELLAAAATDLLGDRAALTRALLGGPTGPDAEPPGSPEVNLGAPRGIWRSYGGIRRGGPVAPMDSDG